MAARHRAAGLARLASRWQRCNCRAQLIEQWQPRARFGLAYASSAASGASDCYVPVRSAPEPRSAASATAAELAACKTLAQVLACGAPALGLRGRAWLSIALLHSVGTPSAQRALSEARTCLIPILAS